MLSLACLSVRLFVRRCVSVCLFVRVRLSVRPSICPPCHPSVSIISFCGNLISSRHGHDLCFNLILRETTTIGSFSKKKEKNAKMELQNIYEL